MSIPTKLSASHGYGGKKPWICRIVGTDSKFGYEREFLASKGEYSRSGRTGTVTATVSEAGLYQARNTGNDKRAGDEFFVVVANPNDANEEFLDIKCKEETAAEIAVRLEKGENINSICHPYWDDEKNKWRLHRNEKGELAQPEQETEQETNEFSADESLSFATDKQIINEARCRGLIT